MTGWLTLYPSPVIVNHVRYFPWLIIMNIFGDTSYNTHHRNRIGICIFTFNQRLFIPIIFLLDLLGKAFSSKMALFPTIVTCLILPYAGQCFPYLSSHLYGLIYHNVYSFAASLPPETPVLTLTMRVTVLLFKLLPSLQSF